MTQGPGSKQDEKPRVVEADRRQLELRTVDLESLLPSSHRARSVWTVVERLDLSAFYAAIGSRGSKAGRPAIDPKILLSLWLYATSEGVGSARHLSRLCERDDAYRWICGGVTPNHHTLSDFRVDHGEKLDGLLTQVLASLMNAKVLKLQRVAQDGTRVRASAGAASFRRGSTLERCLQEAQAQVAALREELQNEPGASTDRERAARERAAKEREAAVNRALAELPKVQAVHERNRRRASRSKAKKKEKGGDDGSKSEPRVSTTDPDARVMKMGDGGFRPAFNLQFVTDTETGVVVAVGVTNEGTDTRQLLPLLDQVEHRTGGELPAEVLADGGYTNLEAIDAAEARGVRVYAPVPQPRSEGIDPHARKSGDTENTAAWRARMGTAEAKEIYKQRASTAERVHADMRRWRGLAQMPVRGMPKVLSCALLLALTHNLLRMFTLMA